MAELLSPSSGVRRSGGEVAECQGSPRKLLMQKHLSGGWWVSQTLLERTQHGNRWLAENCCVVRALLLALKNFGVGRGTCTSSATGLFFCFVFFNFQFFNWLKKLYEFMRAMRWYYIPMHLAVIKLLQLTCLLPQDVILDLFLKSILNYIVLTLFKSYFS